MSTPTYTTIPWADVQPGSGPQAAEPPPSAPSRPPTRLQRFTRGPVDSPAWARPALLVLLAATAVLYLWILSASGNANDFYAAAVQAGSKSWKALLFGSLDSSNFITVDKPPASLWVMGLSAHIFGYSSWSMLVPSALEGVAAVGLLYGAVRRVAGPAAGLLAGAALALTPVAALMFRFNNPDALLTLLLIGGGYAMVRAIERAGMRWVVIAGTCLGFAFLAKMMQAFLVLPAFALTYLLAAPTSFGRRILHTLAGGVAVVVSAGWFLALVELWPASSRPYIGGSTNNSLLELALGYNGLERLTGGSGNGGGGGGGGGGPSFSGTAGIGRLFNSEMGGNISWLLPAALIALVAGLWLTRRAPRTDRVRASLVLWGLWLIVSGLVFSFMSGTIHPYYTVALAPAIAALVAIGGREAWQQRETWAGRGSLAAMVAITAIWDYVLLTRTSSWLPVLRYAILVIAVVALVGLLLPRRFVSRTVAVAVLAVTLVAGGAGSAAYAVSTAGTAHTGSIVSAGPASASTGMGGGAGGGTGGGMFGGPMGGTRPTRGFGGTPPGGALGQLPSGTAPTGTGSTQTGTQPGGGTGGGNGTASTQVTALLKASTTKWAAATVGSQSAAPLQLASGQAVMAIGGFTGSDATPTLAQFQAYVAQGQIHYFIAGSSGGGGGGGGGGTGTQIATWVAAHYTATTVGGQTVYDLTQARI
jgi:4-amino-4-deoxy-L-arabinose transferase-like glycosyltransferase